MQEYPKNQKNPRNTEDNDLSYFARYSGMAFEMLVIILAGVFGGKKLDKVADTEPLFTAVFSLLAVAVAIFIVIRGLLKKNI